MENEKYGLREAYRDWKKLSPARRKELKSEAIRGFRKSLVETAKDLVITVAGTSPLMLGIGGLAYSASKIETPSTSWSYEVRREDDATILEGTYNFTGGKIRYVDRHSDGLDVSDDVLQFIPRAGTIERKATEQDIRTFEANAR